MNASILLAAAALVGGTLAAQQPGDREFAAQAARDGMAEVALGRLAGTQGQSEAVKRFGQRMVTDHTRAGEELKAAAARDGIELATPPSGGENPQVERLSHLQGAEFDRAYAQMMVLDHQKAVALFRGEEKSATDSNIKSFAHKTLPVLEEHLKMAQELSAANSNGN